jgi:hypothetical protein
MSAFQKQVQEFNGEEQLQFKQGKGRFNMFAKLSDLWESYFKAKVENISYIPPYKTYSVILSQGGADAPIVDFELENTTGCTFTYEYFNQGQYQLFCNDPLFMNVSTVRIIGNNPGSNIGYTSVVTDVEYLGPFFGNVLNIYTFNLNPSAGLPSPGQNNLLMGHFLELRFYS